MKSQFSFVDASGQRWWVMHPSCPVQVPMTSKWWRGRGSRNLFCCIKASRWVKGIDETIRNSVLGQGGPMKVTNEARTGASISDGLPDILGGRGF